MQFITNYKRRQGAFNSDNAWVMLEDKKMKFGRHGDLINIVNKPKFHQDSVRGCRYIQACVLSCISEHKSYLYQQVNCKARRENFLQVMNYQTILHHSLIKLFFVFFLIIFHWSCQYIISSAIHSDDGMTYKILITKSLFLLHEIFVNFHFLVACMVFLRLSLYLKQFLIS